MPMIHTCAARGCSTLTMGELCVEHEAPAAGAPTFPRGRPHRRTRPASVRAARVGRTAVIVLAATGLLISAVPADGRTASPDTYPLHKNITATVFWIGEPVGNGSTENNAVSAYDDRWLEHYGGVDDYSYVRRYPYFPRFVPRENPFYLDVPYDDFRDDGSPRPGRMRDVPWAAAESDQIAAATEAEDPVLSAEEPLGQGLPHAERDRAHLLRPGRGRRALPLRRCPATSSVPMMRGPEANALETPASM